MTERGRRRGKPEVVQFCKPSSSLELEFHTVRARYYVLSATVSATLRLAPGASTCLYARTLNAGNARAHGESAD